MRTLGTVWMAFAMLIGVGMAGEAEDRDAAPSERPTDVQAEESAERPAEHTFVLMDGRRIEGKVLRISGRKITLQTRSGILTYDVMQFDEDTRTEHFEQLETDLARWHMQAAERAEKAKRAEAEEAKRAERETKPAGPRFDASKLPFFLLGFGILLCLIGSLWLIVEGFAVSPGWGIALILFNGLAGFAFLVLHSERAKAPIGTWVAGMILLVLFLFAA